jgi:hypothetical protein
MPQALALAVPPPPLFPPELGDELARLPGARHAFLRQLLAPDGAPARALLQSVLDGAPPPVAHHLADQLGSLRNDRLLQGYAEASTLALLQDRGWTALGVHGPRPTFALRAPDGAELDAVVLSWGEQRRPGPDREVLARLARALDRVGSRQRVAVVVRRWLPHDFDPEPVRRAIDLWLREVERGTWEGRYAAYDDAQISLEFALTGERARGRQGVVTFVLPPTHAHHRLRALGRALHAEIDAWRLVAPPDRPLLAVAFAQPGWDLAPGGLRELLLGKADRMSSAGPGDVEWHFGGDPAPTLFRDPLHRGLQGLVLLSHPPSGAPRAEAWLNPWATTPLPAAQLGLPGYAPAPPQRGRAVVRRVPPLAR